MSNRRYIIFSATIVALLAGGFLTAFRFAESKSIISVLNKRISQLVNALPPISADGTIPRGKFDGHKVSKRTPSKSILSFCPKKFEAAWLEYIQAAKQAFDQDSATGRTRRGCDWRGIEDSVPGKNDCETD